ncbi:hypothetical protein C6P40_004714 [Pichia californica]|uniref:Uncharacterized protein n=1 Tax=Pichia californica TaxID=460514 RepID=A0A9P6WM93_9ASCO|nr:hypothetical protein C6P42_004719 [[Candida] californica]KAG0689637.1 hypothetical protein C6P40_004714 [[Candida] californica]
MAIPSSDSVSSFSTAGSSQFLDARSNFTDADAKFEDAGSNLSDAASKRLSGLVNSNSIKAANINEELQTETKDPKETVEKKEVFNDNPDDNESKSEGIKTKQPQQVEQPSAAFVSKEEKIRKLKEQKSTRGYQRSEGQCHEYFFQCNILQILDLPELKSWPSCLCIMCCNSCLSSGTTAAKTAA